GRSERQAAARVITREGARRIAREGVCEETAARALGVTLARHRRLAADDFDVEVVWPGGAVLNPGADVEARVTVRMPAVEIPGIGAVGAWSWTARHPEPVDLY